MLELRSARTRLGEQEFTYNLSVEAGEIVTITGESGAGKSTLLHLVSGFVPLVGGDLLWQSHSIADLSIQRRPVSLLFQKDNLFQHMNVRSNVGLGLDPGLKLHKQAWQRVDEAIARMGIAGLERRLPGELSGGEQQRVALARVMLMNRPVLLLDEPFNSLDQATRESVLASCRDLSHEQNLCTLIVTHNREDITLLGARNLHVENHQIVP